MSLQSSQLTYKPRISYYAGRIAPKPLPSDFDLDSLIVQSKLRKHSVVSTLALTDQDTRALTYHLAQHAGAGDAAKGFELRDILPLTPGDQPSKGQVILKYANNEGIATLVGRGLPLDADPDTNTSNDDLIRRLKQTYHLGAVTGNWGRGELLKVTRAFELIHPADREALFGVGLNRVPSLPAANQGHQEAHFSFTKSPYAGSWGVLRITDLAFVLDGRGFYGGSADIPARPHSFLVILHEVGHVIETALARAMSHDTAQRIVSGDDKAADIPQDSINPHANLSASDLSRLSSLAALGIEAFNAVANKKAEAAGLIAKIRALGPDTTTFVTALETMQRSGDSAEAKRLAQMIDLDWQHLDQAIREFQSLNEPLTQNPWRINATAYARIREQHLDGLDHAPWLVLHPLLSRYCDASEGNVTWSHTYRRGEFMTERENRFTGWYNKSSCQMDLTQYTSRRGRPMSCTPSPTECGASTGTLWGATAGTCCRTSRRATTATSISVPQRGFWSGWSAVSRSIAVRTAGVAGAGGRVRDRLWPRRRLLSHGGGERE